MRFRGLVILGLMAAAAIGRADPPAAQALINDGFTRQGKGDLAGALADFDQAIQISPDFAPLYNDRGCVKLRTKDFAGAISDFSDAVRLDPNYAGAYRNRGVAHEDDGDYSAASDDFHHAIALKLTDAGTYENLANAERLEGDFDSALKDSEHAVDLTTKKSIQQSFAYMSRGDVKLAKGDFAGALEDYQTADTNYPGLPAIQYRLGGAHQAQGDWKGALAIDDAILKAAPHYSETLENRGVVKGALGDLSGALADLRQYLSLEPKRPERAPFLVWILRVKLNQKAAADQELNAYLASAPIGWESKIGGMLIGQIPENDFLSAANSAASPGRAQLQQKEAWYYAGMKHLLAGDNESAMADFKKCVAFPYPTEPEDTWAHAELGALK